jgi:hypothetical protein
MPWVDLKVVAMISTSSKLRLNQKKNIRLYARIDKNLTLCPVQSRLRQIYHGQLYARVDLNPMPESALSPVSGTLDLASGFRSSLSRSVMRKDDVFTRTVIILIVRCTAYLAQSKGFLCYSSDKESKSHGIFHAQLLVNVSRCLHTVQKAFIKRTVSRNLEMVNVYLALPKSAAGSLKLRN